MSQKKVTTVQALNLSRFQFYIGGLPPKVRLTLHPQVISELDNKLRTILVEHPRLIVDGNEIVNSIHDLIIVVNSEMDICIIRPNFIYFKQTLKSKGIIVCGEVEAYHFQVRHNSNTSAPFESKWVSQTLGR